MKCPKCQYLGFEPADRCRNCGYEFSLATYREPQEIDASIAPLASTGTVSDEAWDRFAESGEHDAVRASEPSLSFGHTLVKMGEPVVDDTPLPLFAVDAAEQPLVRPSATPRKPVAVRRTPQTPRLRPTLAVAPEPSHEPDPTSPELEFVPETPPRQDMRPTPIAQVALKTHVPSPSALLRTSSPRRRCLAAVIDYGLLAGIDIAILYFTVRMAGLDLADWRLLPLVPLVLFLGVIALAYVGVFTALGGQTIGKMAARIRVVSEDGPGIGFVPALQRTGAVVISWLTGGLGFLPALVGDHRALHDRLSRTRVVDLESL